MPTSDEIKAAGGNDVGQWGDKRLAGYTRPLRIGGEEVEPAEKLPAFGAGDSVSSMGDLVSTASDGGGTFGDLYESESPRTPLRP